MTNEKQVLQFTGAETIADILEKMPVSQDILLAHGLSCVGCHVNVYETLEQGCRGHGYSEEEFQRVLTDLNDAAKDAAIPIEGAGKPVILTELAAQKILEFQKDADQVGYGFKVEVTESMGELSYFLDFLEKPEAGDRVIKSHDIDLFLDTDSYRLLLNSKIDFLENSDGESGFKIDKV